MRDVYAKEVKAEKSALPILTEERDHKLLKQFAAWVDAHLASPDLSVDKFAAEMSYGRTSFYNKLKSIDNLAGLSQLSYVYMDYNELTNVNALADSYRLVQVNVYGNDIDTVAELTAHDIIVNYDPT